MTDWGPALRHAAVAFGVVPDAFWRLSVREWRALAGVQEAALGQAELEALMRAFPDGDGGGRGRGGQATGEQTWPS